nr:hypothetical protein BaRGS_002886 [Batillaria attramentaria]
MDEDSGEEDLEGGVPANLNRNQLLAGTAVAVLAQGIRSTYGQDEASEDVVNIQETPDDIRLRAWRVVLDAGFLRVCPILLQLRRICLASVDDQEEEERGQQASLADSGLHLGTFYSWPAWAIPQLMS